jgi:hypothetical protein
VFPGNVTLASRVPVLPGDEPVPPEALKIPPVKLESLPPPLMWVIVRFLAGIKA